MAGYLGLALFGTISSDATKKILPREKRPEPKSERAVPVATIIPKAKTPDRSRGSKLWSD
jgi:hypothetical protein